MMIKVTLEEFKTMNPCEKDVKIPLVKHLFPLTTEKAVREVSIIWAPANMDDAIPDWYYSYRWLACHIFDYKRSLALLNAFPSITERYEALKSNHTLWLICANMWMNEATVDLLKKLLTEQEKDRPLFQRRHYKAIAFALKSKNPMFAVAEMFKKDNPNFDCERFFKECRKNEC